MLLRLTEGFAPSAPLPSPELERLRADVVLASVAASVASPPGARATTEPRGVAAGDVDGTVRRSRRRRHAFDLDARLRAADLRAQERALAQRR